MTALLDLAAAIGDWPRRYRVRIGHRGCLLLIDVVRRPQHRVLLVLTVVRVIAAFDVQEIVGEVRLAFRWHVAHHEVLVQSIHRCLQSLQMQLVLGCG